MMDMRFMLGRRVAYRGRIGTVVNHQAITDVVAKSITIRFEDGSGSLVPSICWPWVKVLDEEPEG